MTKTIIRVSAAALALCLLPSAWADEQDSVDEVVVYAQMSISKLRKEVHRSAEDFYDLFNELNDDDHFDVRCNYERPTGSRIRNHVCKAKFIDEAQSKHALRNWDNRLSVAQDDVGTEYAEMTAAFEQKLATTVAANPELQARLNHYNTVRAVFAERVSENKR